ncbi:T9SS type A sorting domain-containing protein [Spirosoma endophyticum]|uniref:Por secretion system C-terminal sorting domain-containing protein n=1 Tax=Spirosoma endophyticum TaxID=662367 RepID=A0A1I1GK39_9BACT|nr:T9SS type A sorting domain-containing protein [Spirosoma endophyticum]SFC12137.1 Por secretion system C-terminal sorting domain-containing protein [Spirosoma endophyticum]
MKIALRLIILLLINTSSIAQVFTILGPQRACRGQAVQLQLNIRSDINSSRGFSVQISSDKVQWQTLSSQLTGTSTIQTVLPDNLPTEKTIYLHVSSIEPVLISNDLSITINGLPSARLVSAKTSDLYNNPLYPGGISMDSLQLNRLSNLAFQVAVTGGGPYQITLNDSSTHPIDEYRKEIPRTVDRSFVYRISRVRNECGVGTVTANSFSAIVNPISMFIPEFGTSYVCAGKPFPIKVISTTPLPASTTLYAILTPLTGTAGSPYRARVLSTTSAGVFDIIAPTDIQIGYYHISLRSDSPRLRVDIPGSSSVQVTRTNRFTIRNPVQTIAFGASAKLSTTYDALYQRITFDDGFVGETGGYSVDEYTRNVSPTQNTVYTIRSVGSAYCGAATTEGPLRYTVNVAPGLVIDSLSSYEVCTGTSITGYYRANFTPPSGSPLTLQIGSERVVATILDAKRFQVQIPSTIKAGSYVLTPIWDGLSGRSSDFLLIVKTPPIARLSTTDSYNPSLSAYDRPGVYYLKMESGTRSNALDVSLSDGQAIRKSLDITENLLVQVFAEKTTNTFRIMSVRNECGVGVATGSVDLTVSQPSLSSLGLQVSLVYNFSAIPDYCPGDSAQVTIRATNLPNTPIYQIEFSKNESSWAGTYLTGPVRSGAVKVKLPATGGVYWLRVKSTETGQVSVPVRVYISDKLLAAWSSTNAEFTGQPIRTSIRFSGSRPPFHYRLSNGVEGDAAFYSAPVTLTSTAPAAYSIVSATGGCAVPVELPQEPFQVKALPIVKPEILTAGEFDDRSQHNIHCEGGIFRFPYLLRGVFPSSARLEARLYGQDGKFLQKLTVLDPATPVTVRVDSVPALNGQYRVRLFMMLGDSVLSTTENEYYSIIIHKVGTVQLTGGVNGKLTIARGSDMAQGAVTVTGGRPVSVWLSNGTIIQSYSEYEGTYSVPFNQEGVYTITQAVSACGLMPTTGQVDVSFQPAIKSFSLIGSLCKDQPAQLNYQTVGAFAPDNEFTFEFRPFPRDSTSIFVRTKQTQGPVTFQLPSTIRAGAFGDLIMRSSNPAITYEMTDVSIRQRPTARLIPSTTTIYPGQSVDIPIELVSGGGGNDLRFENGPLLTGYFDLPTVEMTPKQTTTYRLAAVSNSCGVGTVSGEVTVIVTPRTTPSIEVNYIGNYNTLCAGKESYVSFKPIGTFDAGNLFSLQLSDSTGQNYRTIATNSVGAAPEFRFTLPADHPSGRTYRLRIASSNPVVTGSSSSQPIAVSPPVTGKIISPKQQVKKGESATVTLQFTGIPPFRYALSSAYFSISDGFGAPNFIHTIRPRVDTSQQYKLLQVNTPTCGDGVIVSDNATMIVDVVGQSYDIAILEAFAFPNPTTDILRVGVLAYEVGTLSLTLRTMSGDLLFQKDTPINNFGNQTIPMSSYPTGLYILTAKVGDRQRTFRIMKIN